MFNYTISQAFISCETVSNFKNYRKAETNHVSKFNFFATHKPSQQNSDCNSTQTQNYLVHKTNTQPVFLNSSLFVSEQSSGRFESGYSRLIFKHCTCFKQGVSQYLGNLRVQIHSKSLCHIKKCAQKKIKLKKKKKKV